MSDITRQFVEDSFNEHVAGSLGDFAEHHAVVDLPKLVNEVERLIDEMRQIIWCSEEDHAMVQQMVDDYRIPHTVVESRKVLKPGSVIIVNEAAMRRLMKYDHNRR